MLIGILLVVIIFKLYSIESTIKKQSEDPIVKSNHVMRIYDDLRPHIGKEVNIELSDFYLTDYNYSFSGSLRVKLLRLDRSYAEFSYVVKKKESFILVRLSNISSLRNVEVDNEEAH